MFASSLTLVALMLGVLIASPSAYALADDALRLVQAVHGRPAGRDLTTVSRMELTEKGRAPRIRQLVTYRLVKGGGQTDNLVRFLAPQDIAGTGLLNLDKGDGSADQWLYLPALDRARRIAGDRKGGRFVGSDLFYEDLQERHPALDQHRLAGRETWAGAECEVIESVAKDPTRSVYRKRLSWVDPQTAMVLRVDYFEKDDQRPSKRWTAEELRLIQNHWTVIHSRMVDLASGHETRMIVESAKYDRNLPTRLFSARALSDERLESEFRP